MKSSFAIAATAGIALAGNSGGRNRPGSNGGVSVDPNFLNYTSQYGKDYRDPITFQQRQDNYQRSDGIISAANAAAEESTESDPLRLGHNFTSDMSQDEYLELLGLDTASANSKATTLDGDGNGRRLANEVATTVDHAADGFMHPVKNQGGCGSCWAFGANTTMEGTYAKKTNSAPLHFSEQQIVDCTLRNNPYNGVDYGMWGCQGGWMDAAWKFQHANGAMLEADYPYTSGRTGTESQCVHDDTKVVGKAKEWGQITTNVSDMKDKTMQQPLSVALNASSSAFQFYSSGVVRAEDGCGTSLNHAVVIVGFTDSSYDPEPNPDPEPTPDPDVQGCKVTKWWHSCDEEQNDRRRLQDAAGHDKYWKVQNSWGTNWGDNGFIRIAIESGDGVCGINKVVEWVEFEAIP